MAKGFFLGRPIESWLTDIEKAKASSLSQQRVETEQFFHGLVDAIVGHSAPAAGGGAGKAAAGSAPGAKADGGKGAAAGGEKKKKKVEGADEIISLGKEVVSTAQHSTEKVLSAKEREIEAKKNAEQRYADFSAAMRTGLQTGMSAAANDIGNAFAGLVVNLKNGSADLGQTFRDLASAMAKSILNAVGDSLIQKGAGKLAEGIAGMITNDATASTDFMGAAILAAAGGAVKGVAAAFLEEGGLVTRPTLAMVGEGGADEAVIPLDRLDHFAVSGGKLKIGRFESVFPGIDNQSLLKASLRETEERRFVMARQKSNRRLGNRLGAQ